MNNSLCTIAALRSRERILWLSICVFLSFATIFMIMRLDQLSNGSKLDGEKLFVSRNPDSSIPEAVVDSNGVWSWFDFNINVIVVVVTETDSSVRTNAIFTDSNRVTVKIGADDNDRYLTFYRTTSLRNRLLLINADGRSSWIAIGNEEFASIHADIVMAATDGRGIMKVVQRLDKNNKGG